MQMRTFGTVLATLLVCKAVAGPQPLHSGDVGVTLPLTGEQSAASAKPNFEVASIKLNEHWKFSPPPYSLDSDEDFVSGQSLFIVDAPLTSLIAFAYKPTASTRCSLTCRNGLLHRVSTSRLASRGTPRKMVFER